ncbi:hypothetical protein AB0H00_22520 [Nocardia sp. NPDC023852]|uniref:hypothetical protein n=1 Tax=Nocardia sp. NPDC023852 TaxID=3154697 RepID=UPI00340C2A21
MNSAMLALHFAIPMPGAVMHQAYLAAIADLVLSGGMLLRTVVFRRPSRADGPLPPESIEGAQPHQLAA